MGYDMQEGTVVRWLKSEGSEVQVGEPVAEVETDKAVVEFESYAAGVIQKILVPEGTTVPVGQPIALVGAVGEALPDIVEQEPESEVEAPEPAVAAPPAQAPPPALETLPSPSPQVRASPVARRIAVERGIDVSQVKGTGPGGRITKGDVLAFEPTPAEAEVSGQEVMTSDLPPAAAAAAGQRIPLSRMRQQIARVTVKSKQEKPHFYVSSEIEMTRAMDMRHQINQAVGDEGVRVTVNDLVIKACVESLKKYPKFNSFFQDDAIQMNEKINVGIAIAEEEGLIVPAIMDCANRSLKDIASASRDLAARAKTGTLHPQEYTGGTFAISNLGMFDVTSFVAIIHPPQSAVLAVGTVTKKPVVKDDQITIGQTMTATVSADHRVVDGAEGARFLIEVKRLLENPIGLTG